MKANQPKSSILSRLRAFFYPPARTHDYTVREWGHDSVFTPIDGGQRASVSGWGYGLERGDYALFPNGERTTRYRIDRIEYYRDPPDMWHAEMTFAPRQKNTKGGT